MAEDPKIPINELPIATSLDDDDLIPVTQGTEGHFTSRNTTISDLKTHFRKDLIGTLVAGETLIEFTDPDIYTDSTIDVYTSVYGVSPKAVEVTLGRVSVAFKKQDANLGVKVRIS